MHPPSATHVRRSPPPMPLTAHMISVFAYALAVAMVARALFFAFLFVKLPTVRFSSDVLGEFVFSIGLGLFAVAVATLAGPEEHPRAQRLRQVGQACARMLSKGKERPPHTNHGPATLRQARRDQIVVASMVFTAALILLTLGSLETVESIMRGGWWLYPLAKTGFFLIVGLGATTFAIAMQPWWVPPTAWLRNLHREVQNAVPLPTEAYTLAPQNPNTHA